MDNCKVEIDGIDENDYLKPYPSTALVSENDLLNLEYVKSWLDEVSLIISISTLNF